MPAPFNRNEEKQIINSLKSAGRELFTRFGIRKTTIDALAAEAGIGKGTFYRFFPSKEELYMTVMEEEEALIHGVLREKGPDCRTVDDLAELTVQLYSAAMESPIVTSLISGGEYEYLVRKLPPERLELHQDNDLQVENLFIKTAETLGFSLSVAPEILGGILRGLFLMTLHRNEIGNAVFEDVIRESIKAVVRHTVVPVMEGESNDKS